MAVITSSTTQRAARSTDWKAGILAGIIAAIASDVVLTIGVLLRGESAWLPSYLLAAMILGDDALAASPRFDAGIVAIASLIHFALAIGYGLIGAWLFDRLRYGTAAVAGAVYGAALYLVNYDLIAPMLFPWLTQLRGVVGIVTHIVFGAVLALSVVRLRRRGY